MMFFMFTVDAPAAKIGGATGSLSGIHSWPYKVSQSVDKLLIRVNSYLEELISYSLEKRFYDDEPTK